MLELPQPGAGEGFLPFDTACHQPNLANISTIKLFPKRCNDTSCAESPRATLARQYDHNDVDQRLQHM